MSNLIHNLTKTKNPKGDHIQPNLRILPLLIMLNIFFFSFLLSATAATGIINNNYVNVRSGPATTYNIVGRLDQGSSIEILGSKNDWYQIKTKQLNGWVKNDFINLQKEYSVKVTANGVNLRSGPGTTYNIVGSANNGDILTLLATRGDWYQVKTAGGSTAYINASFAQKTEKTAPAPSPSQPSPSTPSSGQQTTAPASAPVVIMDGSRLTFDVPPIIENGRTLVPLRAIFEAMGASVSWDNNTRTAVAVRGTTKVVLPIGSTRPTVNGQVWPLDVPAKIKNNRTLAPLRFVGEAFGGKVDWNNSTRTITITSPTDTVKKANTVIIQGNQTNLRSGPATTYDIIDTVNQGEKMPILAEKDGWYQVNCKGRAAWVAGWLVDLAWEENQTLPPEEPVEEPKPDKPGPGVIWLSFTKDESGLQIRMDSGAKLEADIKETSTRVTYEFKDRQIEGLYLVKQSLGSGEVKAKARNEGDNTIVEIDFPYNTRYQTASEDGGNREVFIIPNAISSVERKSLGSMGDRLIINTLTPAQCSRTKNGDTIEIRLQGVLQGKAQDEYKFDDSTIIKNTTFKEISGTTTDTIIRITTSDLGKYMVGQNADGSSTNILLVGKDQIKTRRENLVVLDPGHGGRDTGARGKNLDEKEANLKIALKVGELLKDKGIEVEYTRTTDIYLGLEERAAIANRLNAGLFVSIHNNASTKAAIQGTETYYYAPVDNDLLFLQLDERKSLAAKLHQQLIAQLKRPDRGVKTANFSVLRNTTMPSALVECVFISNPDEEKLLQQNYFIQWTAEAIANGIAAYMGK
ncbi:MAG: SH3 domain-containing protein [Syntrophomonadaceae bacterium]|nr:SH3 domain-containing protein [Syntrophomonadaceae bacterium]